MKVPITLHEDVYRKIKAMIVRQELAVGSKLSLRTLAKQLGTSTTPVIEAIRRLERDGLITQIPKWGAYIKEWTEHDRLEAYHIRRALEGEAARLFVLRASQSQKDILVQLSNEFDKVTAVDPIAALEIDIALHFHIAHSTGFERLAQLVENSKITWSIFLKFTQIYATNSRVLSKPGNHEALVQALLRSDPMVAMQAMWGHIDGAGVLDTHSQLFTEPVPLTGAAPNYSQI
jgi:DNA-binding GntR family transcriptional regulator